MNETKRAAANYIIYDQAYQLHKVFWGESTSGGRRCLSLNHKSDSSKLLSGCYQFCLLKEHE